MKKTYLLYLPLTAFLTLNCITPHPIKANQVRSIWDAEDYINPAPNKPLQSKVINPQTTISKTTKIKPKDGQKANPFQILQELSSPDSDKNNQSFLGKDIDPKGQNLDEYIPLDVPLSERQADILDPIKLDISETNALDLSLERALLISLESNLPQRIIDETVIRDKWKFWNTGSFLLPDGFLGYTMVKRDGGSSFSATTGTPINQGANNIFQLGIRYNLAPSQIFSTMAAYYDWMANSSFRNANLQELIRQTINQYYEVMKARGELAVRIEAVRQGKIQLALNKKLEDVGLGTKFAVLQAKQQLAENELALEAQQASARIAEVQLLTVLNMPLGTDLRLAESEISRRTLISSEYKITELIDAALKNRPDISRRNFALKAARRRITQAAAQFAPSFVGSASMNSFTNSVGKAFEPRNLDTFETLSIGFDWSILQGLGLRQLSSINQRRAESRQAGLELKNEILQVKNQVRNAFLRSESAKQQITTAQEQLDAASSGIKLARIRLQNGVGTNIDLLDTQRNYVNAMISKVRATIQYNQSQVDLLKAIGWISVSSILDQKYSVLNSPNSEQKAENNQKQEDGFVQADYSDF